MGTYPAAPGHRMPYDEDGSRAYRVTDGGGPTLLTTPEMVAWNNEDATDFGAGTLAGDPGTYFGILFPQLRDIAGYYLAYRNQRGPVDLLQTSADTTDGFDGTWTTRAAPPYNGFRSDSDYGANGWYRINAQPLTVLSVVAIRFHVAVTAGSDDANYKFHVYGDIAAAVTDRLAMWAPGSDSELAANALDPGDAGDVVRSLVYTKQFRIKNLSGTKTATNIVVSSNVLTDNTPSVILGTEFSDGGPFAASVTIPTLAPGGISDVITLQYTVATNAQLHTCNPRVNVSPTTFA